MRNALCAAAALLLTTASATAGPFINGGFEDASVDPGAGFTTLPTWSQAIDGWMVIGDSIDYVGGYWQPYEGQRSIDLNGLGTGGIQQSFDTIAGELYRVTFYLAGNPDGDPSNKTVLTVGTGGQALISTYDATGSTREAMNWMPYTYTFTAGGATSTLTFTSLTQGAYGPALDAVSVVSLPEPATWGLMILGLGTVGALMRRRPTAAAARLHTL